MNNQLNKNDELLMCFNENGEHISSISRALVHSEPLSIWHAVTSVWIFNNKGQILVTRRGENNEGNPGKWQTYVGGHVKASDTVVESAINELNEEIGLKINFDQLINLGIEKREEFKHFQHKYFVLFNNIENLNFNDGEVVEAKWMSFDEYLKDKEAEPEKWCNGLNLETYKTIIGKLMK